MPGVQHPRPAGARQDGHGGTLRAIEGAGASLMAVVRGPHHQRRLSFVRGWLTPLHRYGRPPGALFTIIEWLRTAATLAVVAISLRFTGFDYEQRVVVGPLVSGLLAVPSALLGMALVAVVARRGHRMAVLRSLRRPLLTLLAVLATGYLMIRAIMYVGWHDVPSKALLMMAIVVVGLPLLAVLAFVGVRHWFNAADGHPMLPALCAIGYALTQLIMVLVGGTSDDLPPHLRWLIGLGSPLTLAAVAAAELLVWRYRRGVSLRTLPPPDAPAPWHPPPPRYPHGRPNPYSAWR
jgi:hypothetical protein